MKPKVYHHIVSSPAIITHIAAGCSGIYGGRHRRVQRDLRAADVRRMTQKIMLHTSTGALGLLFGASRAIGGTT
jgi:hypothetical protein